jgi:hypothetical protein
MIDLKHHTTEMCEMQRTIDNEMKLQEFLGVKGQCRKMNDLQAKIKAEKEYKRKEMRNKIGVYNEILALIKQFTGNGLIIINTLNFNNNKYFIIVALRIYICCKCF